MKKIKAYLILILLLFLASLNFNLFLKPNNFICGGTNGLAIIIKYYLHISYFYIILIINLIMLLISFLVFKRKTTIGTIISTFLYPLFVFLTRNIYIKFNYIIIPLLLASIMSGLTNGLIYKLEFTTGGINIIGPLLHKYFSIKIGTVNLFINFIIIIFNIFLFGLNNFILSLTITILNSIITNIILYKKI